MTTTFTTTMVGALNSALREAMATDDKVIYLGEDVADPVGGVFKVTAGLSEEFGSHRVRPTPISEQAIIGASIGASMAGYRPVAEIMLMDFIGVCLDQIANHAAKLRYMSGGRTNVPMTIVTVSGTGHQFGAQHSGSLEAWLMHTPGLKVATPSTPADAKGLLAACIEDDDPCVLIEPMTLLFGTGEVPEGRHVVDLGVAATRRSGADITLISWGRHVTTALSAADELALDGIDAEVLDLRSLLPLDHRTILESVARTKRCVVIHGATQFAGPGAEIAAMIHAELFGDLAAPVMRLGGAFAPPPFAADLEAAHLPDVGRVVDLVRSMK